MEVTSPHCPRCGAPAAATAGGLCLGCLLQAGLAEADTPPTEPEPAAHTPPPFVALGPYRILGTIGRGGMGVVLRAEDPQLGRTVAIKVLAPEWAASAVARQRFLREARAMAAVRDPHVVTVHASGEADGVPYLVMEYVAGPSLQQWLDREGPLPIAEVVRTGAEVARGLAAAHAQGLIHRDIKPANVLLSAELGTRSAELPEETSTEGSSSCASRSALRVSKISDFGLARAADEVGPTGTGQVPGTPLYMAPEQALGQPLDGRADLFSLGSVLYTLCTGRPAFLAEQTVAILRKVCDAPHRPVRDLNPNVPPWLAAIIDRLLAKRPADRFPTAAEVAQVLGQGLEHLRTPAKVPAPILAGRPRRRRGFWAGVGALLVLMAGLAMPWGGREAPGPAPEPPLPGGWEPGPDANRLAGLVLRPAHLPGLGRWQVYPRAPMGAIGALAWSPDGRWIACTVAGENTLRLYEAASSRLARVLPCGDLWMEFLAWQPDSQAVAVTTRAGVRLWNVDGRPGPFYPVNECHALAWHPEGRWLAVGGAYGSLQLLRADGADQQPLEGFTEEGRAPNVLALAWAPDGRWLAASCGDQPLRLFQADGTPGPVCTGHTNLVWALTWAPDGRRFASAGEDGTIRVWGRDGQPQQEFRQEAEIRGLTWTPDGAGLVSGGPGGIVHWRRDGARRVLAPHLPLARDQRHLFSWNADHSRLAVVGRRFLLFRWDGQAFAAVDAPNDDHTNPCLSWAPDGRRFAVGTGLDWDFPQAPPHGVNGVLRCWSADGTPGPACTEELPRTLTVAWHPDGGRFASGGRDGVVRLWQAGGPPAGLFRGHHQFLLQVAFHPDGAHLVSLAHDGTLRAWDAQGAARILYDHGPIQAAHQIGGFAVSPDGGRVAVAASEGLRVFPWAQGDAAGAAWPGHRGWVKRVAWSGDGHGLASLGDFNDATLRFWHADGRPGGVTDLSGWARRYSLAWRPGAAAVAVGGIPGIQTVTPDGQLGPPLAREVDLTAHALAWSPDGRRLAAALTGGPQLWEADGHAGPPLQDAAKLAGVLAVAWGPAGLLSGGKEGIVLWAGAALRPIRQFVPLPHGRAVVFSPAGEVIFATPGADEELVYVVEADGGRLDLLTPAEFRARVRIPAKSAAGL